MLSVKTAILTGGIDTAIGNILAVQENAQWLAYLVYSIPHIALNLPPLTTVQADTIKAISQDEVYMFVESLKGDSRALKQMEDKGTDEAFYLAVKSMDKLAIAAYTLYLYGSTE